MRTGDVRVQNIRPLISPAILLEEMALTDGGAETVVAAREAVAKIVSGEDDRLLVVVGPCSIHQVPAALEYGALLRSIADELREELCLVMRVYFEKPRTTVGWKGLINDPDLDDSFHINDGLRTARKLLLDLCELGLPCGCEFLDPISPQFIADLVSWGAIGARTTESQVHRELASGLSMPIGFKNGTDGGVDIAIEAVKAAASPHHFLGVTEQGLAGIIATMGNPECHVILRGGASGSNYDPMSVGTTAESLEAAGLRTGIMIDCSHGNSGKDPRRQADVADDVTQQVRSGQRHIMGVMMESFLVEGRQDLESSQTLRYGQSITDACMSWASTVPLLHNYAEAVRERRKLLPARS
jgi:3-deoxy-7-phosphoheptulonate synthase